MSEPPRAPLAFSVPAVTVPQQAIAVNPVLPVQRAAIQSRAACQPQCRATSEMDRLVLEAVLKRLEAAEARGAEPAKAPAAQGGATRSTKQRLSELENRLDRILEALE